MKLNINCEQLMKPLLTVAPVVESRHPTAILTNVLLQIQGQQMILTATDSEVELQGVVDLAEPFEQVEITVPARKLLEICRSLPQDAALSLHFAEHNLIVEAGHSRFKLATLPANQFPLIEPDPYGLEMSLRPDDLLYLCQHTHFAVAQQDVRYFLNGLLLEFAGNILRAVATDGHRLAISELPAEAGEFPETQLLLPRKTVNELLRLLVDREETIQLSANEKHVKLAGSDFVFISTLIKGRYPDYTMVIPKPGENVLKVEKDLIKQSLTRAAILANEKFRGVRLQMSENLLRINANNVEQELAEEELEVEYQGSELEIALNVGYLLDVFNAIESQQVQMTFVDASTSVVVKGVGEDNNVYVVMPMRI